MGEMWGRMGNERYRGIEGDGSRLGAAGEEERMERKGV